MKSVWQTTSSLPTFPPLEGDRKTEILVIGGGIAGLLCTHFLREAGADCLLLEANTICGGTTGHTTAKITAQHGLVYHRLLRQKGESAARQYLEANLAALSAYRSLAQTIDCDFEEQDSFVYSLTSRAALEQEAAALRRLGAAAEVVSPALPFPTAGAVRLPSQAQFHPLKFLSALAKPLPIREHTRVQALEPGLAHTNLGSVRAQKIIVATHFPFLNRHGSYFLKLYQQRSYVLALKGAPPISGMYVDEAQGGFSLRPYGDLLLLGGGGGRTGKPYGSWEQLSSFARRHFPQAEEASRFAAQDCVTLDGLPYIGPYSASTPWLFTATGFGKWGITTSMAAARLLTDFVQGRPNPYASLFSPSRSLFHPQLAANALEATANLLTPTVPRCPHMGCALKYNPEEHTWDCPCHGSRFAEDGRLLDNPANRPLSHPPKNKAAEPR